MQEALITTEERELTYEGVVRSLFYSHLYNYKYLLEAFQYVHKRPPKDTQEFLSDRNLLELLNKLTIEGIPDTKWIPPKVSLESPGLMSKLIFAYQDCSDSTLKLLISSCIEGFLRVSDPFVQLYIIQMGLFDSLIDISVGATDNPNVIQAASTY